MNNTKQNNKVSAFSGIYRYLDQHCCKCMRRVSCYMYLSKRRCMLSLPHIHVAATHCCCTQSCTSKVIIDCSKNQNVETDKCTGFSDKQRNWFNNLINILNKLITIACALMSILGVNTWTAKMEIFFSRHFSWHSPGDVVLRIIWHNLKDWIWYSW